MIMRTPSRFRLVIYALIYCLAHADLVTPQPMRARKAIACRLRVSTHSAFSSSEARVEKLERMCEALAYLSAILGGEEFLVL